MPTHRLGCTKCSKNSEARRQHGDDSLGKELCDDWLQSTPHNLLVKSHLQPLGTAVHPQNSWAEGRS